MDKIGALRKKIRKEGLSALLVPRKDAFQSPFLPPGEERLRWLTGFSGSSGFLILTEDRALFFTDGRYTLQAKKELPSFYEIHDTASLSPAQWLRDNLKNQEKVGYDPWLFTESQLSSYKSCLVPLTVNLIDSLWEERPQDLRSPIVLHSLEYAGESSALKRARLVADLKTDHLFLTTPESIAWLLNIRGRDVPYTPLVRAMCLLKQNGSYILYVDTQKITPDVEAFLQEEGGSFIDFNTLIPHLSGLSGSCQLDPDETPVVLAKALKKAGVRVETQKNPCLLLKAIKNQQELGGSCQAHIEDGVALCRFFTWLQRQPLLGETTEYSAAQKLYAFRQEGENFKGLSFETISAFGPHGAIIHYHPSQTSSLPLTRDGLYLLDSGGQYLSGTTDVTRTLALGIPSLEQKEMYTRVLKGHLALSQTPFPAGTTGTQLDSLARQFLWAIGQDYAHGTGHGVGSYLNVHEGPQAISFRGGNFPLHPGMILSNEPGYYKEGEYGIRLENLLYVKKEEAFAGFYRFETLTLVPFDLSLVQLDLLTREEKEWMNAYHARILKTLSPRLTPEEKEWLSHACRPL